jgi:hypothetical protein
MTAFAVDQARSENVRIPVISFLHMPDASTGFLIGCR